MTKVSELRTPDKISLFNEQDRMLQRIIDEENVKIADLQRLRENLVLKNNQLDQDLNRKRSQYEQWVRSEEQKLQENKNRAHNEIIVREKKMEVGELDLVRRQEEISKREKLGMVILEKQAILNSNRLDIEKLRSSASLLMDNANRKMSEASSIFSQANIAMAKAKEMETKSNAINDTIVKREQVVTEKEKDLALRQANLEEIQKIIDPKLQEIKSIEDRVLLEKKSLIEKENSVNAKIVEEKTLLRDLEIRQKKLLEKEKELNQREEDMVRKNLMIGMKDAK